MSVELSIVMPCLNEAETIESCITKALNFLKENNISGEVVIGDNGSTDGSQNLALALGARVVDVKEKVMVVRQEEQLKQPKANM